LNNWVIIGRDGCSWCTKADALLREHGFIPMYLNISEHDALLEFLRGSDLRTVPQVFNNGNLIGGYEQLKLFLGE
jgi:glutaredoxin